MDGVEKASLYRKGQATKLVRDMVELRLEEAIIEMPWLASDEVSPEKLKTREDQDI